ncbi:MAG TPA: ATP-binding protein [Gemmatimonadaceae bacterium]|nr:ATP-binding protein [Gemmatimonadaceae bacterium]
MTPSGAAGPRGTELADSATIADDAPRADAAVARPRLADAAERLAFLVDASVELSASLNYRATLSSVARMLVGALGDVVILDALDDGGAMDRVEIAVADPALQPAADALLRYSRSRGFGPLAERVRHTREPALLQGITDDTYRERLHDPELIEIWRAIGPSSLMCVPMIARDRIVGLIGLVSRDPAAPYTDADVGLATAIARRAALALDNARLFREANAARARAQAAARSAAYLSQVSATLAATIDYEETLARVADLVVPAFGDYCQLFLVDAHPRGTSDDSRGGATHGGASDGGASDDAAADGGWSPPVVRRVASACVDPARAALLDALGRTRPLPLDGPQPPAVVARTGRPMLLAAVDDATLRRMAVDDAHLELLRDIGMRSFLVVPLATSAGRVIGALAYGHLHDHVRAYDESDLQFATELARRAGLAIENARLYEEARAAQHAAAVANRTKSDFLATMSHELRTPLSAIIGYGELLADGVTGPVTDAQHQQLRRIGASARHLLTLIEDILTFARLDAGREETRLEPVDVATLARDAAGLVEPIALTQGLTLDVAVAAGLPHVTTDERRLRQILLNLLGNAVRYTERGGVRLEVEHAGDAISFAVSDTGIGIAPEHLEHIFEPFWQVEQHLTRKVGGTGLGLSVTRRLARILGGDVGVRSTPGVGSTFTVTIPIAAPEAAPPPRLD